MNLIWTWISMSASLAIYNICGWRRHCLLLGNKRNLFMLILIGHGWYLSQRICFCDNITIYLIKIIKSLCLKYSHTTEIIYFHLTLYLSKQRWCMLQPYRISIGIQIIRYIELAPIICSDLFIIRPHILNLPWLCSLIIFGCTQILQWVQSQHQTSWNLSFNFDACKWLFGLSTNSKKRIAAKFDAVILPFLLLHHLVLSVWPVVIFSIFIFDLLW